MDKILINHIGYHTDSIKHAVLQQTDAAQKTAVSIKDTHSGDIVWQGFSEAIGEVANWKLGNFGVINFSDFKQEGSFRFCIGDKSQEVSEVFNIKDNILRNECFDTILDYYRNLHPTGAWDEKDKAMGFYEAPDKGTVDVSGGWYDASGDKSKYLSHLSYANYMNPQQTPIVVWNMLESSSALDDLTTTQREQLENEIVWGADFLLKMQDPEGFFYTTVFDTWSHDPEKRYICTYKTQAGIKNQRWQAAWRQGGGVTIAALARASLLNTTNSPDYLTAAQTGFDHLVANNSQYIDDGVENIIDDYCALMAANELFLVTQDNKYQIAANKRIDALLDKISSDDDYSGWFSADNHAKRSFFHAAEEGLPLVALTRAIDVNIVTPEAQQKIEEALNKVAEFYCTISFDVNNPFHYPRQYAQNVHGKRAPAFFFPHENESGYWWQGENARLGSMSAAFKKIQPYITNPEVRLKLATMAENSLNWILGLNPYNICMLQGKGYYNPPEFQPDHLSIPGGICNGITGGFWDESSISFAPTEDEFHSWRWSEQWIPHSAWFLLAISL